MKNAGILLIVIGALMMVVTGFNFVTREKVVDIGDLEIEGNRSHRVEWPPIAGGLLLAAGVVVTLAGKKKI